MKRTIGLLMLVTGILLACNAPADKERVKEDTTTAGKHKHAENSSELVLNNGKKWKADSITNHNVIALKTTADMFRVQPFPSINNYQLLGSDLSKDLNTLLQQCQMKGDGHDVLHVWLEPILNNSNDLKTITDTAKAREIFKSVDLRIDAYRNYFE